MIHCRTLLTFTFVAASWALFPLHTLAAEPTWGMVAAQGAQASAPSTALVDYDVLSIKQLLVRLHTSYERLSQLHFQLQHTPQQAARLAPQLTQLETQHALLGQDITALQQEAHLQSDHERLVHQLYWQVGQLLGQSQQLAKQAMAQPLAQSLAQPVAIKAHAPKTGSAYGGQEAHAQLKDQLAKLEAENMALRLGNAPATASTQQAQAALEKAAKALQNQSQRLRTLKESVDQLQAQQISQQINQEGPVTLNGLPPSSSPAEPSPQQSFQQQARLEALEKQLAQAQQTIATLQRAQASETLSDKPSEKLSEKPAEKEPTPNPPSASSTPLSPKELYHLASQAKAQNNYPLAESLLKAALLLSPAEAALHYNLGNLYLAQEAWPQAQAAYEQALAVNPSFSKAYFNLGLLEAKLKQTAQAQAHFTKYLELEPQAPNRVEVEAHLAQWRQQGTGALATAP